MFDFTALKVFADLTRQQAGQRAGETAHVFEDRTTTFGELDARASRIADGLIAAGVGPQARIGYVGMNSDRFFDVVYGSSKANVVPVGREARGEYRGAARAGRERDGGGRRRDRRSAGPRHCCKSGCGRRAARSRDLRCRGLRPREESRISSWMCVRPVTTIAPPAPVPTFRIPASFAVVGSAAARLDPDPPGSGPRGPSLSGRTVAASGSSSFTKATPSRMSSRGWLSGGLLPPGRSEAEAAGEPSRDRPGVWTTGCRSTTRDSPRHGQLAAAAVVRRLRIRQTDIVFTIPRSSGREIAT